MEVCLIGRRPHSDVSPWVRLHRRNATITYRAKPTREHTLATSREESMEKLSNLSWQFFHMQFMTGKRSMRPCPNVLIFPAQSGLGMLPQPYCMRAQTVYLEDDIENRLDIPQKDVPRPFYPGHGSLPLAGNFLGQKARKMQVGGNITQVGPEMSSPPSAGLLSSIAAALWADAG